MQKTSIEWTATYHADGTATPGYTSNPIRAIDTDTGRKGWACTKVSAGCDHCYAEVLNRRWGTRRAFDKDNAVFVDWVLVEEELRAILRAKATGARVFVGDMTDLFHERVRREWLDRLFAVFALRPDLTFQVLTKRPHFARRYLGDPETANRVLLAAADEWNHLGAAQRERLRPAGYTPMPWPLPNVWLGTSVEDQAATWRVPTLLACPAAVRFLSCEPLIGPLTIERWLAAPNWWEAGTDDRQVGARVDWVIAGGESGAGHRVLDLDHARRLRDECAEAGVPYFFKQVGGITPKAGGHLLDGVAHRAFPAVAVPW